MFGLFVALLDILAILSDPEEWAELSQLPIHNLLLKSNSKELVLIVQVNVRSLMEFLVVMHLLMLVFMLQSFLSQCQLWANFLSQCQVWASFLSQCPLRNSS